MLTTENLPKTRNGKITEALGLLNEAAKEKREELKELLTDKYAHVKDMIVGKALVGEEKVKEVISEADKRVHKDPWPYIAGATAFSLLLGYLVGSKSK